MHHEERSLAVMERLAAKPVHQFCSILRRQHILDRVLWPESDDVFCDSEEKQIMVSQHDLCGRTQMFDVSEDLKRVRSSIHQVADEPQLVCRGLQVNAIDELNQLRGATLHIADGIGGH